MMDTEDYIAEAKKWPQFLAAFISIFGSVASSTTLGWSSPAIFYLQNINNTENLLNSTLKEKTYENQITDEEISLISSILLLGAIFGSLPAGLLCEKFGRRTTLLLGNLFLIAGWVIICSEHGNVLMLFIARALHGITLGLHCVAIPLYNEEITEVKFRGATGALYDFSISVSLFLMAVFQAVTSYSWMNISCIVLAIISAIGILLIPESPIHYLKNSKIQEAEKSLRWLRGVKENHSYGIATELSELQRIVNLSNERVRNHSENKHLLCFRILNFQDFCSTTAKSIYIIAFLMILRQFSGINFLSFYTIQLFQHSENNMSPFLSTFISRLIQISFNLIPVIFVDRIGRRIFLLFSSSLSAASLLLLSIHFYLKLEEYDTEYLNWLPVFSTAFFFCMFSFGLGPIPWFMMAEIVPTESKGWVTGLCSMVDWFCAFIAVHFAPTIINITGYMGQCMIFCFIDILGFIVIFLVVPETKNKSIETIHEELVQLNVKIKCF